MDLLKFYNREINVLDLGNDLILGRESNGIIDYMTIRRNDELLYAWFHNPKKKLGDKEPKHTGGKKPYVKLMLDNLATHKDLSLEAYGFIYKMAGNIQWNTNLLVDKRSKKPLLIDDMIKMINVGKNKTLDIVKELKDEQLLIKDKDGYKITSNLIQKGGSK